MIKRETVEASYINNPIAYCTNPFTLPALVALDCAEYRNTAFKLARKDMKGFIMIQP
jgi:hypothetical protein